jgi:hypothetical protein
MDCNIWIIDITVSVLLSISLDNSLCRANGLGLEFRCRGRDYFPLSRPGAYPALSIVWREGGSSICLLPLFRVPLTFSFVQLGSFPGAQAVVSRCSFRCCLASMTNSPLHSPFYVTVITEQVSVMFFLWSTLQSCQYLRLYRRMLR